MPVVSLKMDGLDDLLALLNQVSAKVESALAMEAALAGAEPVLAQMHVNVAKDSGNLDSQLAIRKVRKRRGRAAVMIGTGTRDYEGDGYYGSFVEYGYFRGKRDSRQIKGSSRGANTQQRKWVPPQPWARPAVDSTRSEATEVMRSVLRAGIEAEARRR